MKFRFLRLAAATVVVGLASAADAAPLPGPFSAFLVFGDSLSDPGNLYAATGNAIPPAPYDSGRFSNGPVWAERVAEEFAAASLPVVNFAYGGARATVDGLDTPDFAEQLALANLAGALDSLGPRPLAALWFGANDILDALNAGMDAGAAARTAADSIATFAPVLGAAGVRDLALFTLGDLALTPSYALFQPAQAQAASDAAAALNDALRAKRPALEAAGFDVTYVELTGLFEDLIADPSAFGLTNATLPCLYPSPAAAAAFGEPFYCGSDEAENRAWFDSVHPSAAIHARIATEFESALAPVPLPAAGWMALAGAAALVAAGRKRPAR